MTTATELEAEQHAIWKNLTEDQRIAATCVVISAALDHATDGGTYRHLIYDRLGLTLAAYVPVYNAGGMMFSNECVAAGDGPGTAIADALELVRQHAMSRPMQPSGILRDDGSDITVSSDERHKWFDVLDVLSDAMAKYAAAHDIIAKQRAELDATRSKP